MIIRKATLEDSATIASCILLAMEDIVYQFLGDANYEKANEFLQYFTEKKDNQYSWENCWVAAVGNEIVAAVNVYDGSKFSELRKPIIEYIQTQTGKDFNPEEETQSGEYYIDALGVNPDHQGKGIGTKIIRLLINEYVDRQYQTLGLLVEEGNLSAKKLYFKLGFKPVGKKTLAGKRMDHLQLKA